MDDYILEILKMQEQPEESQHLKLQLEEIKVRGRDPEADAVQEQEMLRSAVAAVMGVQEAAAAVWGQSIQQNAADDEAWILMADNEAQERYSYRSADENAQWLLRQMEPLEELAARSGSAHEGNRAAGAARKGTETGSVTFGYAAERSGEAGISPETLSMFFQRDARRYS